MVASREDLIFNLKASNQHLQVLMNSNVSWDMRNSAFEQLQRNLRALGESEVVIACIPVPATNYVPPTLPARPWAPDPADRSTFEDPHPLGM
jgi:hypothetical protein